VPSSWALLAAGLASILADRRLHAFATRANGAEAASRRVPHREVPESPYHPEVGSGGGDGRSRSSMPIMSDMTVAEAITVMLTGE
jgi:hypothetical protein